MSSAARRRADVAAERSRAVFGDLERAGADDDPIRQLGCRTGVLRGRDAEARIERHAGRGRAGARREVAEGAGEALARSGRAGDRDEVEPAVRLAGGEANPLVRRSGCDELDAADLRLLSRRKVGDDHARGTGGASVRREALPAVGLEQRGVGHRHQRHVDACPHAREAVEAGLRAHPLRERPLGGSPDHGAVGERVGEGEAELDEVGAALHRRLGQLRRVRAAHQVDREGLAHGLRRTARMCCPQETAPGSEASCRSTCTMNSCSSGSGG